MNIQLLKDIIIQNGLTQTDVANELGMSQAAFVRKLNTGRWGSEDADRLIELLAIDDPTLIFFNEKVT